MNTDEFWKESCHGYILSAARMASRFDPELESRLRELSLTVERPAVEPEPREVETRNPAELRTIPDWKG